MAPETAKAEPQLFLEKLKLGVTGTIVLMVCCMWDVYVATGLYLSTDFVVCDAKGSTMHATARGNIAHNFLRLKEGGIYSVKNFAVQPNKDEFWVIQNATFMLELDGATTIRKAFVKPDGFIRYPFQLVEFDNLETANNKYLIDAVGYVTNVGRTVLKKTGSKTLDFHLANSSYLGSSNKVKQYNGRLYLSSTSLTLILDDEQIPEVKHLKADSSGAEFSKEILPVGCSEAKAGTLENLLMWARNRKHDVCCLFTSLSILLVEFDSEVGTAKGVGESGGSSAADAHSISETLEFKRLSRCPSVATPSKPGDDKKHKRLDLEDSDAEASFVADTQTGSGVGGSRPDTRKNKRYVVEDSVSGQFTATKRKQVSLAIGRSSAENHYLANILQHSVMIHSNTIIRRDGKVQSYCGLLLKQIAKSIPGTSVVPDQRRTTLHQQAIASTSNYPFFFDAGRRKTGSTRKRKSTNTPKQAALTSKGAEVSYHNIGAPSYQCVNCYASMWYKERINKAKRDGVYTFRVNGKSYHRIGSLLPKQGTQPRYAQLWFFDTDNEVRNCMGTFINKDNGDGVDATTVQSLIQMLDQYSSVAKEFRMPIVAEVAALITNDFGDGIPSRDIIVNKQDYGPERISELHPVYMVLQYPLLFPYGEDGFQEKIPYHSNIEPGDGVTNSTRRCHNPPSDDVITFHDGVPRYMAWLDYDEYVDSPSMMDNEVGFTSLESTTQTLPLFEEYTPSATYPEEVEMTLGTSIEPQHLLNSPPIDVSLGDVIGPKPPIKPHSPDSSRMKVVYYLTTQTPHSPHVANPHPKGVYSYYNPGIDDPKRHYGFKPGLLGKSVSLGVDISNWEMFDDDWRLESKEVSPLGEELSLFDRPNEVERGRILKAHRLEPILQQQNSQRMALSHHG
ncbi:ribonuclease H-like domain-containing protein, partial [Tanacetum coccineum]